ncbi:MAG: ShlB/FhaC/HecB family hemolysin secretion/activation protein [Phycisphaeraceae bacterium]|nr:ShlB/FhaC/HecB family hemolysin secretion/activation protein [Phycisphaeraceae bacterium]
MDRSATLRRLAAERGTGLASFRRFGHMASTFHGGIMLFLLLGVLTAVASGQDENTQPAPAEPETRYFIRSVTLEGVSDQVLTRETLLATTVRIHRVGEVWSAVDLPANGDDVETRTPTIGRWADEFPQGATVDASVIRAMLDGIFRKYRDAGVAAVRTSVTRASVEALTEDGSGTLIIQVEKGRIDEVRTVKREDDATIPSPRHDRIARRSPVGEDQIIRLDQIDRYVGRLNRHPGRRVDPILAPSEVEGRFRLDYMVTEPDPWSVYAQVTNTGTPTTGRWRQRFGFIHNNLTNADDILSLDYMTGDFDQVHAFSGSYSRPLDDASRIRARVFGSWSQYRADEVGLALIDLRGEGYTIGGDLTVNVFQQGSLFVDLIGGLRYDRSEAQNITFDTRGDTGFVILSGGVLLDHRQRTRSTSASIIFETSLPGIAGTQGDQLTSLGRDNSSRSWVAMPYSLSHTLFLDALGRDADQPLALAHELALSVRGQVVFGGDRVPPTYTQTAGGFYTVRGYPDSFTSGDNAFIGTVEYRMHIPSLFEPGEPHTLFGRPMRWRPEQVGGPTDWNLIARAFLDVGFTSSNNAFAFESDHTLIGAGVGLEMTLWQNLQARMDLGFPLHEVDNGTTRVKPGSARIHVSITVSW